MLNCSLYQNPNIVIRDSLDNVSFANILSDLPAVVICDPNVFRLNPLIQSRFSNIFNCVLFKVLPHREPTDADIKDLALAVSQSYPKLIVSVGGGSTIDSGKGLCCTLLQDYSLPEHYESPGLFEQTLTHITFVTTSGPGAEASPAMIYSTKTGRKSAVVDDRLIPDTIVIVPPLLTTLPLFNTSCCVFDGIVHSFESLLFNRNAHLARPLAVTALEIFLKVLPKALAYQEDVEHREELAIASFLSSTGLRVAGAGAAHAFASGLPFTHELPHGALVAICMLAILRQDMELEDACARLDCIAQILRFENFIKLFSFLNGILENYILPNINFEMKPLSDSILAEYSEKIVLDPRISCHFTKIDEARIYSTLNTIFRYLFR